MTGKTLFFLKKCIYLNLCIIFSYIMAITFQLPNYNRVLSNEPVPRRWDRFVHLGGSAVSVFSELNQVISGFTSNGLKNVLAYKVLNVAY